MCGAVKSTGTAIKSKLFYSGYRFVYVGDGSWSFGNEFAWKIIIFVVNNSFERNSKLLTNRFLLLGAKKRFSIDFF